MKTTLRAAYFKNRFNRVSNCAITQDICTRLLGLLHAFVYQSYNNKQVLLTNISEIFKDISKMKNIRFKIEIMILPHVFHVENIPDRLWMLVIFVRNVGVIQFWVNDFFWK